MASIVINRSDLWPVGTSVGAYPRGSVDDSGIRAAAIASATVASDGSLTITDAGILSLTPYTVAATVSGQVRHARARSTLDVEDRGTATGTVTTVSGSASLSSVVASTGAYAVGQFITGAGIRPGTRLKSGSGNAWVMDSTATASASSVAVAAYGGRVPAANLGSTLIPSRLTTPWPTQLAQRKSIAGIN